MKIAIVDDNHFLIASLEEKLKGFPEIQIKFAARHGLDLIEKLKQSHAIDLILMDIEMPEMNGIEATRHIKEHYPQIKIIMLTVVDNDEYIFNAIQAGADGYLLKDVTANALNSGIIDTLNGGAAMTPSIALKTLRLLRNPFETESYKKPEDFSLTERETEILEQLSKGLPNKMVAENLFISVATVGKHIENIYSKLQVHSRLEAVIKAKENNII